MSLWHTDWYLIEDDRWKGKWLDTLVTSLTFAAGLIDALVFLALGGVFASFMSGNTLTLGLRIGL